MQRNHEKLTLGWLVRHPLVATCILLALTIALPYLRVGERLKLLTFLPVARASGDVAETPYEKLSAQQRAQLDLARERERVSLLETENARLREAISQHDALRSLAPAFAESPLPAAVTARVIFKGDASTWRHCCWINRGRKHGIEDGMPVVAGRSLVGRVFMAGDEHACVQLLTDPGFAAACIIVDPDDPHVDPASRVRAVLRGDGSAMPHFPRLELEDVPAGAPVKPGMHVVTNDYSGQYPVGLSVGVVRETIPQAGFLQVRMEANLDLLTLEVLQVLLHKRPELEKQALALIRRKK
ncbi:MAG: rod shape-determining protein MreC [Planctomycetes bacterium]|nr:rod shape-determining protein MreC [Planctomycetota bacterium]MCW8134107.1 rod shape-determining protein MreC [Planctomycetota bacterium]